MFDYKNFNYYIYKKRLPMTLTMEDIHELAEGAIILTDLDRAIVGITEEFGNETRILYSVKKIVEILTDSGMSDEEAIEYYQYNILGGYFGERNPIFLADYFVD